MSREPLSSAFAASVALRTSCLVERANTCIAGFDRLGKTFSADTTRQMLNALECGAPGVLYEHWISEQEARLAALRAKASPVLSSGGMDRG